MALIVNGIQAGPVVFSQTLVFHNYYIYRISFNRSAAILLIFGGLVGSLILGVCLFRIIFPFWIIFKFIWGASILGGTSITGYAVPMIAVS
jgi:hypothetical protein